MFSKKKVPKRTPRTNNPLGMDFINNFDPNNMGNDDDDDDEDLEAELLRLTTADDTIEHRPRRPAPKPPIKPINLDILNDDEIKSDEELSGDDDDPDLLNELDTILGNEGTPEAEEKEDTSPSEEDKAANPNLEETIKLLEERLALYKIAEARAKDANETTKVRRYGRGVKTLQGLLHSAKTGKNVDNTEIPPELPKSATQTIEVPAKTNDDELAKIPDAPEPDESNDQGPAEIPAAPEPPPAPVVDEEKLAMLKKRQQEYRIAAVTWKKSGNLAEAVNHVKIAKQFDMVITALTSGQPIDLSDMPPTPTLPGVTASTDHPVAGTKEDVEHQEQAPENAPADSEQAEAAQAPITGDGIAGALKERLEVYRRTKTAAEEEGNSSKARRYGRICKQYEDAIKLHARGKAIPVDDLPIPPGFPPIVTNSPPVTTPVRPAAATAPSSGVAEAAKQPVAPPRAPKNPSAPLTRAQKQTILLQRRQAELKRAALTAKKDGDIELARDYLRQAKGLDKLIGASESGLPVDMASIPLSPNAKAQLNDGGIDAQSTDSFTLVSSDDIQPGLTNGTDQEIYDNLEATLIKQKKVCLSTRDHAKALGDVPGYNRWERMALGYTRDLDMLRVRKRDGLAPPQHHYETKTYAIVQSCTDLTDSDLEISIIRGVNYPKECDTYVMYEFPFPSESPPSDRTSTIKGTTNPEYDSTFTLTGSVERSSRQCQRAFKRHGLKCQVWSKGCSMNPLMCCLHPRGFFRSDSLLGTVTVKLQPLETQCILHDSFPLMNGRKATGGKLEVKIRLRNPITTKQIEKMTDKWLIIDY